MGVTMYFVLFCTMWLASGLGDLVLWYVFVLLVG